jgi:hypothetical protein
MSQVYANWIEDGRRIIYEIEDAAKSLLQDLHTIFAAEGMDPVRKQKCSNMLLSALAASRSTKKSRDYLTELDMRSSLIEAARQHPQTRNAVLEVLEKFGPGEC